MGNYTRRRFLSRLCVVETTGAMGAGCSDQKRTGSGTDTAENPVTAPADVVQSDFTCTDITGLSEEEAAMRMTFQYTDISLELDRNCRNCALYVEAESGTGCGSCLTIKGPIHPEGYCSIWAAQTA